MADMAIFMVLTCTIWVPVVTSIQKRQKFDIYNWTLWFWKPLIEKADIPMSRQNGGIGQMAISIFLTYTTWVPSSRLSRPELNRRGRCTAIFMTLTCIGCPHYRHQLRASMGISAPYSTIQTIDTTVFIVVIVLIVISKLWVGLRFYFTLLRTCQVNLWTFQLSCKSLQKHFILHM